MKADESIKEELPSDPAEIEQASISYTYKPDNIYEAEIFSMFDLIFTTHIVNTELNHHL